MLLAIDIGNTNTSIGMFEDNQLKASWNVATDLHRTGDQYAATLLKLLEHEGISSEDVTKVAMCSVVPPLVGVFEQFLKRYFNVEPLLVEAGTKTGVRIRMDNPREVGADRIVNAAAAHHLYGGAVIIVDLGTATTFDTVSAEGDYLGGAIAPGIDSAVEALTERAAMLPRIELVRPANAIGTNTVMAMQSGMIFGYIGMVEEIVRRISAELEEKPKVIATGGYAELMAGQTDIIEEVNKNLTLIGLKKVYFMNRA
jgi:type III pantothenate kinase